MGVLMFLRALTSDLIIQRGACPGGERASQRLPGEKDTTLRILVKLERGARLRSRLPLRNLAAAAVWIHRKRQHHQFFSWNPVPDTRKKQDKGKR